MALKRQHEQLATFSMASLTDVIFLLLVFFMVTSTFVFPTAFEVNLPQSNEQTTLKPGTRVFIDKDQKIYAVYGEGEATPLDETHLVSFLQNIQVQDPGSYIALYADETIPYGKIVEILNLVASNNLNMVLATKPASSVTAPTTAQPAETNP